MVKNIQISKAAEIQSSAGTNEVETGDGKGLALFALEHDVQVIAQLV